MKKVLIIFIMISSVYTQCLGDMNDDYVVDIQDVVIMVNIVIYDDEIYDDAADINHDGNINILDIIGVINIILYENNPCVPPIDIF